MTTEEKNKTIRPRSPFSKQNPRPTPFSDTLNKEIGRQEDRRQQQELRLGPVRVVVLETGAMYRRVSCLSICNGIVQVFIGATNIMALGYSLTTGDSHACLAAAAWHFFTAEAILSLSSVNGWASTLKLDHKKLLHMVFQVISLTMAVTATVISCFKELPKQPHGITGLVTMGLAMLAVILGPLALVKRSKLKIVHACLGLPAFCASSVCFSLGLLKEKFQIWSGEPMSYILIGFIVYYTLFIIITVIMFLCKRMRFTSMSS